MNKSRYDYLASQINKQRAENVQQIPKDLTPNQYWEQNVKSKEDAENFFKLYYPSLPDVVCKALARHLDQAVSGEIELDKRWLQVSEKQKVAEEIAAEIEEQRRIGLMNLQNKSSQ